MSSVILSNFDYSALPDDLASDCHRAVHEFHALQKRTVQGMAAVGLRLVAIRERLEHGQFLKWVEAEFGSKSTAYRLISIAESFEPSILPTLGSLDLTAVHALAAAPAPTRQEIVGKLASGERLTSPVVRGLVSEAREREKQEKASAKLTPEERKREDLRKKRQERRRADWAKERNKEAAKYKCMAAAAYEAAGILLEVLSADVFNELVGTLRRSSYDAEQSSDSFLNFVSEAAGLKVSSFWRGLDHIRDFEPLERPPERPEEILKGTELIERRTIEARRVIATALREMEPAEQLEFLSLMRLQVDDLESRKKEVQA